MQHIRTSAVLPVQEHPVSQASGGGVLLLLFTLALLIPAEFEVFGLSVNATRIYLLTAIIPLSVAWLAGRAGRVTAVDLLIICYGFWVIISFLVNHGLGRFAYGGVSFVELFGGYLVGRILIRDAASYRKLFNFLFIAILVLLPFAFYEVKTDRAIMQEFSKALFGSSYGDVAHPPRWGLYRAQSVMQHPILFGVFCSMIVGNAYFIWRLTYPAALARTSIAIAATFTSLSSGPLLSVMVQLGLIGWRRVSRGSWKLLAVIAGALYVFLSIASNRGPVILLIETLTFNSDTGWTRIHIWRNGIDDVMRNKLFGIGLRDWTRPFWLTDSVDNFWLLTAMRHGIVGFAFLAAAILWHFYRITRVTGLSEYERNIRLGYLIVLFGLCFTLATVHIWGPTYTMFMAYLGAGAWFYTGAERRGQPVVEDVPAPSDRRMRSGPVAASHARPEAGNALPFSRGRPNAPQPGNRSHEVPPPRSERRPGSR